MLWVGQLQDACQSNNATIIGCGRSASVCPWHHMTVRGRGTVENQNGASSPGHFLGMQ